MLKWLQAAAVAVQLHDQAGYLSRAALPTMLWRARELGIGDQTNHRYSWMAWCKSLLAWISERRPEPVLQAILSLSERHDGAQTCLSRFPRTDLKW